MTKFSSCIDCTDRKVGCHSTCQKYLEDKAKNDAERDRIFRIKEAEKDVREYEFAAREKANRRKGFL